MRTETACHGGMAQVLISYQSVAGEESDEYWPSVDAFRNWAHAHAWRGAYRVYEADEDGDWVPILRGRIAPTDGATS